MVSVENVFEELIIKHFNKWRLRQNSIQMVHLVLAILFIIQPLNFVLPDDHLCDNSFVLNLIGLIFFHTCE